MRETVTNGYESLKASVMRDCDEGCGCFNPNGCNVPNSRKDGKSCFHDYCNKFKWVVDRAKHYGEKLDLNWEDVLTSWENQRNHWYMNYYQECERPEIKSDRVRVFETVSDMRESIGERKFRCPACGGVSASPYACDSGVEVKGKVCDWKVYGLFRDLGKGTFVYVKEKLAGETIFMPLAWEAAEVHAL